MNSRVHVMWILPETAHLVVQRQPLLAQAALLGGVGVLLRMA